MKGIGISCASHASTAIYTPITMDQPSSSSATPAGVLGGSRAIDRHNPIIADERRVSRSPTGSSPMSTPPLISHQKQKQKTSKKKSSSSNAKRNQKSLLSKPSDLISIKQGGGGGCAKAESSRYLLGEGGSGFLDRVLLDHFDPALKLKAPCTDHSSILPPNSSSLHHHQVVVLRVSLHCRGCEGKLRKHISRMQGVKSFNIDFAAKKVTVVGDMTPLQVLTSISKVKKAQLWTPPPPPASASATPLDPTTFQF